MKQRWGSSKHCSRDSSLPPRLRRVKKHMARVWHAVFDESLKIFPPIWKTFRASLWLRRSSNLTGISKAKLISIVVDKNLGMRKVMSYDAGNCLHRECRNLLLFKTHFSHLRFSDSDDNSVGVTPPIWFWSGSVFLRNTSAWRWPGWTYFLRIYSISELVA